MSLKNLANNHGYTLMELIIAMSMILTISAVAVPNYTRYIASTREKVCILNRQAMLYEYRLYCITDPEISLSEYLSINYAEEADHFCPYEGIYTASGSGETVTLVCSKHHAKLLESSMELIPMEIPEPESLPTNDLNQQLLQIAILQSTESEIR